jgi:dimethylargininase
MFKNFVVRRPGKSVMEGQTTADLGVPVFEKAYAQHEKYIETCRACGVQVKVLEADEKYPDGCFVEDPAVVTDRMAVITNLGVDTRQGEETKVKEALTEFFGAFDHIVSPGHLEGGDVMQIEDHFYIGLSKRTNEEGARQFIEILEKHGYTGSVVELKEMFHLKSGVNYIGDNRVLVAGEFIDHPDFEKFEKILVPADEMYAANCIRVNDHIIMPAGFPKLKKALEDFNYDLKLVEMTEFQKIDGGLSCLSLRF